MGHQNRHERDLDAEGRAIKTCRVRRTTRSGGWAAKAVHSHSLWIEPCECREGCKHSTEAAVDGRSLERTGHQPPARRPPRQTSLQHEVVSSTVIRPCSRELLPGTLPLALLPPYYVDGHTHAHTHTRSRPPSPAALLGPGSQRRRSAKRSKTLSPELSKARCLSS